MKVSQQVWNANLSGSPIDLPEVRSESLSARNIATNAAAENWDALTNAGLNGGNAAPRHGGQLQRQRGLRRGERPDRQGPSVRAAAEFRAAGRLSDYSLSGTTKTWNIGADYAPIDAISFRATYAKAVRAPNIGELFTGPSQTFPPGIIDPCIGITAASTGTIAQNCLAAPGVGSNMVAAEWDRSRSDQADTQGISGFNTGNPNLKPEIEQVV